MMLSRKSLEIAIETVEFYANRFGGSTVGDALAELRAALARIDRGPIKDLGSIEFDDEHEEDIWQAFERVLKEHPEFDGVPAEQEIGERWVMVSSTNWVHNGALEESEDMLWWRALKEPTKEEIFKWKEAGYRAQKVKLIAVGEDK